MPTSFGFFSHGVATKKVFLFKEVLFWNRSEQDTKYIVRQAPKR